MKTSGAVAWDGVLMFGGSFRPFGVPAFYVLM